MKCLSADDSADSRVKVGHRQANIKQNARSLGRAFLSSVCRHKLLRAGFVFADASGESLVMRSRRWQRDENLAAIGVDDSENF